MRLSHYLILCLLFLSSCEVFDKEEQIPAYIHIDSFVLETQPNQGTASHNFLDAWVYVNGAYVGTFELPADVPILAEGTSSLQIYAGIQDNGFASTRQQYGFVAPYETNLNFVPGEVIDVVPTVTYLTDLLSFDILNFEDPLPLLNPISFSDTSFTRVSTAGFDEDYLESWCARIALDEERDFFKLRSNIILDLAGKDFCYLELDYRNEIPFFAGLSVLAPFGEEQPLIGMNPSLDAAGDLEWKRIYIDLSDAIDILGNGDHYEFFIQGDSQDSEAEVFIDNVRIVYPN